MEIEKTEKLREVVKVKCVSWKDLIQKKVNSLIDYFELHEGVPIQGNVEVIEKYGKIGVTPKVSGNGNTRTFSGNFSYTKAGNRLELSANKTYSIPTNANLEDFRGFFGQFPKITCVAR